MSAFQDSTNTTNFSRVKDFMTVYGQDVPTEPKAPETMPDVTKLRVNLIEEELNELKEAIKNNDFVEVVDALADILYVTYGAGVAWGVDLQKAFEQVHESNMTKICKDIDEANYTVKWYKDHPEKGYPAPEFREAESEGKKVYVVFESSTGKILKNINYKAVNLQNIVLTDLGSKGVLDSS